MTLAPLAEVTRGTDVESIHYGAVAVVDTQGKLLFRSGDPDFLTFTRSTIKPFQALPFLLDEGPARFCYGSREVALLCASHSGEPMHTEVVQGMLHRAGCNEHHLQCGCHVPLYYTQEGKAPLPGAQFSQLQNNCSGKHAGFLAYCVQHDQPLESYVDPNHPLQQAIRHHLAQLAAVDEGQLRRGTDGCSAPNYALPLSRLGLAYARLAQGSRDSAYGSVMGDLFDAMTSHPELVSGTGRPDLALMQQAPGDWVAKGGAEAVQAIGIRSAGLGIAIKVGDGSARALCAITIAVLRQLGLLADVDGTPLASWAQLQLHNLKGLPTGEIRAVVDLIKV